MNLPNTRQARILIVDDVAKNIQLVAASLRSQGYSMTFAQSGPKALELAQTRPFDLVILDIMMPEMDGYEVCRRLKSLPLNGQTPVIFLTAKTDAEAIVQGFEAGAVDYLSKPFNGAELKARVQTHLELKRIREELEIASHLKDKFFAIIAHDLRAPFNALLGLSQTLKDDVEDLSKEDIVQIASMIFEAGARANGLLEQRLRWASSQQGKITYHPERIELFPLAQEVVALLGEVAHRKEITLHNLLPPDTWVYADRPSIAAVFRNLVGNALKFTPQGGTVELRAEPKDGKMEIEVADNGLGMSLEVQESLFRLDRHHSTLGTAGERGTGLGLILCKEFLEKNGGSISLQSAPDQGSRFLFQLPVPQEAT